jgi:hypothetical protein
LEDGEATQNDLHGEEGGRDQQRSPHEPAEGGRSECEKTEGNKHQPYASSQNPMAPFEADLDVELGDHLAKAEWPIRARKPGAIGSDESAEDDQDVGDAG